MNQIQVQINDIFEHTQGYRQNYQSNPQQYAPVIEGYFPKENSKKEMAIRKINMTLTTMLVIFLLVTSISYYYATANEMILNDLTRQTVVFNDENSDLQNKLDRLKSFNNVDITMQKNNILQKAQNVIEVQAVASNTVSDKKINAQKPFTWAIGY